MIAEARAHVAAALTAGNVPCAPYPPTSFTPPAALLYPGDPYVANTQLGGSTVGLRLRLVGTDSGPHAGRILDSHIDAALAALRAAGVAVGGSVPSTTSEDGAGLYVDIPLVVPWED